MFKKRHIISLANAVFLLFALLFLSINISQAAGPVDATSLPGGATVTDTDGGSGEQWGRADGRDITFNGFVLGNFTDLGWQAISAGMAFDGEITGDTLEEMTGPSLILPNTLEWTGQTTIADDIAASVETVYTKLTVIADKDFSALSPYTIDVISAGGDFEINILFEASLSLAGPFEPALEFFDNYPTPIAHAQYAITSFNSGFWYEELVGLTLEEHDSNIQGRFDGVDGAIEFLTIESVNRLKAIGETDVVDIKEKLVLVKYDLEELLNAGGGDWATEEDINILRDFLSQEHSFLMQGYDDLREWLGDFLSQEHFFLRQGHDELRERLEEFQSLMLCMWIGNDFMPVCPPEVPNGLPNLFTLMTGQADIMEKLEWAKENLESLSDQIAASREIDVTVIESPPASGKSEHVFMVLTKVNGVPVDAVITSVNAVTESLKGGIGVETPPFDTMAVATGFQSLGIDLSDGLNSTKTILITVEYVDGDNTLQGATLVSAW